MRSLHDVHETNSRKANHDRLSVRLSPRIKSTTFGWILMKNELPLVLSSKLRIFTRMYCILELQYHFRMCVFFFRPNTFQTIINTHITHNSLD